jgi:uncharacterized membrane protein (UPF0127 family)
MEIARPPVASIRSPDTTISCLVMGRFTLLLVVAAVVVAACSSVEPAPTTSTIPLPQASGALDQFEIVTRITIDDVAYRVAVADTADRRSVGLMGVTELGEREGMLFIFDTDVETGFWMKDTLIPLDIAFFDSSGSFVDGFTMEPCPEDPCPAYTPSGSYRYAVETGAGDLATVGPGSVLVPGPGQLVPPES